MIVRNPTAGEVERAIEVASIAFPNLTKDQWTSSFTMVAEVFGTRYLLVVEDEGQIVSTLICQPMPVYINGGLVSHASTGAVATIPEARCKGCAGAMMTECVRLLRSERVYLSSLWPFSYEYYRKFGWEIGAEIRSYSAPASVFAASGDANNAREASAADVAQIRRVYDGWAQGYNCLTQRTDVWWDKVVPFRIQPPETEKGTIVHETAGRIDGYAAYRINEGEQRSATVLEMPFVRPEHRRDMLAKLATIVPDGSISFIAAIDDLFLQELPNPRQISTGISPSFQFRVTDPPRAMECLEVEEDVSGEVTFSITDPIFKEGWSFGIDVDEGEVTLTEPDKRRALEMDVMTFARLYSGYLSPFDAVDLGKIGLKGDAMEMLLAASEIFSPLTPYRTSLEPG
jgi:predicted acetyltransferase